MKKYLLFLLALMPMFVFNSCSSDNSDNENNALIGTKWEHKTYQSNDKSKLEDVTTLFFNSANSMTVSVDGDYDDEEGFETHHSVTTPYSFDGSKLTAKYNDYVLTGELNGDNLTIMQTSKEGSETFIYNKIK